MNTTRSSTAMLTHWIIDAIILIFMFGQTIIINIIPTCSSKKFVVLKSPPLTTRIGWAALYCMIAFSIEERIIKRGDLVRIAKLHPPVSVCLWLHSHLRLRHSLYLSFTSLSYHYSLPIPQRALSLFSPHLQLSLSHTHSETKK